MFKVLSIDGGGIRGIIPAALLTHIEAATGQPIAELFDLMVGTSTGGIIVAALAVPDDNGKPRYAAQDTLELYTAHGRDMFDRSFWHGITSVGGLLDQRYDAQPLEQLLKQYLGNTTLRDCLTPIVATSYDIERRAPYFFKTRRANEKQDRNHYLRAVARATSAAPTYFEPALIKSRARKPTRRALIDGGVFANNPAMCAYVEAAAMGAKPNDILIASFGTGSATREIPYDEAKDWGIIEWARPILSVMSDGVADTVDHQLRQLLPDQNQENNQRYFRFNTRLDLALDDMDAASTGNIRNLKDEATQILVDQATEMARLIKHLG